uniref:Putative methyltransferase n=2 Tax=viral metagenome TaxID=1070528 RepID=A0A6H2A079_9ZZZZ
MSYSYAIFGAEIINERYGVKMYQQMTLKVLDLKPFPIRELRENVLERLRERIKERGYNVAKSLIVVKQDNGFFVADGNHRLKVLQENAIEEVPCVVYENADIYKLAVESNQDEDVYASMDLFDELEFYTKMNNEGYSNTQICNLLNWDKNKPTILNKMHTNISVNVLDLIKKYQIGRTEKKSVCTEFTLTWINDSGLFDIDFKYQLKLINNFISDKFNWNKSKVQSEAAKYKQWQLYIKIAKDTLVNKENDLNTIIELIENGTFKTEEQLRQKIKDLNSKAKDKLIFGDAVIELAKLDDGCIDIVITDPPYGIDYKSNRSQYEEHVTKNGIENDGLEDALKLLDDTCCILNNKTKSDAHIYIFTSWKVYPEFKQIIEQYFAIRNLIVWDKGNHGAGDLECTWGNRHELIIFATKGNRKINERKPDIINISKLSSDKMIHPTQKPVELIKELLKVSTQPADTICDPFMGSGSTIKAAKEYGNINYIGIELDKLIYEKACVFIRGGT